MPRSNVGTGYGRAMPRYSDPAPGDQLLYRLPDQQGYRPVTSTRSSRSPVYATRTTRRPATGRVPDYRDPYADMPVTGYQSPAYGDGVYTGGANRYPSVNGGAYGGGYGAYPPPPGYTAPPATYPPSPYDTNGYYAPAPNYNGNGGYAPYQTAPLPPVQAAPIYRQQSTYRPPPANTLQAQAQVVDRGGRSPVASKPLPAAPTRAVAQASPVRQQAARPQPQRQQPVQTARTQPVRQPPQAAAPAAPAQTDVAARARQLSPSASPQPLQREEETASLPRGGNVGSVRFLPIIGAPVEAVTPLSRQLGVSARASGLTIKASTDTSSEHILKGYLSAVAEGSQLTINYVWDVLDSRGNRLNRIQGQERVPFSGGDPWAAVPPETMRVIAQKTISLYMNWREGLQG